MDTLTRSSIFSCYNKQKNKAHKGLLDSGRVNRALGICQSDKLIHRMRQKYNTTTRSCLCPDTEFGSFLCKHKIATRILQDVYQDLQVKWEMQIFSTQIH